GNEADMGAEGQGPRDGPCAPVQGADDAKLAVDRVCRGKERTRGLLAQHVAQAIEGGEEKRRIRLPAAELLDAIESGKARQMGAKPALEGDFVETLPLAHRHGAGEFRAAHAYFSSSSRPIWLRCTSSGPSASRMERACA